MSSAPTDPLPPARPRSAFHIASQASWVTFLVLLGINMFGSAFLPPLLRDLISIATVFAGVVLAVIGLCGLPRHGRKGILVPALIGLVLNGLFLVIAVTNARAAAQRARERHQAPVPVAPTPPASTGEKKTAT